MVSINIQIYDKYRNIMFVIVAIVSCYFDIIYGSYTIPTRFSRNVKIIPKADFVFDYVSTYLPMQKKTYRSILDCRIIRVLDPTLKGGWGATEVTIK